MEDLRANAEKQEKIRADMNQQIRDLKDKQKRDKRKMDSLEKKIQEYKDDDHKKD